MLRTENKRTPHKVVIRPSAAMITGGNRRDQHRERSMSPPPTSRRRNYGEINLETNSLFFQFPLELRLEVYQYLLRSPDPVMISALRRQVYVRRPDSPTTNGSRPRLIPLPHRLPHVQFLRTCKRVNKEATPILYGENKFFVACDGVNQKSLKNSFLWHLRQSTLSSITSITFLQGCQCKGWVTACRVTTRYLMDTKQWTTTGPQLARLCFLHYSQPHWLPLAKNVQETHEHIREKVISNDPTAYFSSYSCPYCQDRYGQPSSQPPADLPPLVFS
ncbi:uncharacterized protein F4822DRAFT_181476 [Hypoxylon trugodes]|uniref:uncharacterized protein n=1 Tax=Hypoxylon trugodes TaxID=326681 RepID=UPI0021A09A04|nr:uncharacterized protein F4822DRAFT_181476 [Hypoxylon trugodes]KAI1391318.1 hypothetical protein F4822DRAFT_181476 [Hypoxylon trugodes]